MNTENFSIITTYQQKNVKIKYEYCILKCEDLENNSGWLDPH